MENIDEEEDEEDRFKEAFQSKKLDGQKIQNDFDLNLRTAKGKNIGPSFEQITSEQENDALLSVHPPD